MFVLHIKNSANQYFMGAWLLFSFLMLLPGSAILGNVKMFPKSLQGFLLPCLAPSARFNHLLILMHLGGARKREETKIT